MNMLIHFAIVFLTLRGKSFYTEAHTTRPFPTKFPSNTSKCIANLPTLGMAVASLTRVRYYTYRLTDFACFS